MTVYDWGVIGALALGFVVVSWASYCYGYYAGADRERPRAWSDGYRAGYAIGWRDGVADGCGCPDASSGAMTSVRERVDDDDIERCPECGGNWPECEGIRDDGEMGCTRDGKTNVGWMVARRRGGR